MSVNRVSAYVFAVAASLAACRSTGDVQYAGEVRVSSPELVMISPGVQVIADADEPLFYSDGSYWLYRDGAWLRSNNVRRGFVRVDLSYVPQRLRVIERPQTYVQYRRTHARDYQARVQQQDRERPEPTIREPQPAPPHQGVPSTPPPDTWQPTPPQAPRTPHDPTGINPTVPSPAKPPPITSPADVHGNPMPPHGTGPAPIVTDTPPAPDDRGSSNQARPDERNNRSQPPPRGRSANNPQGTASDRDDRATPPSPPSPSTPAPDDERHNDAQHDKDKKNDKNK